MNTDPTIRKTLQDNDCLAFCHDNDPRCKDCPKLKADEAFKNEKGGNLNFWTVSDDDPEVKYWKEVWMKGYNAASQFKENQSTIDHLREENERLNNEIKELKQSTAV
jgi:hypothetical protein